jgi:hypothetical protein
MIVCSLQSPRTRPPLKGPSRFAQYDFQKVALATSMTNGFTVSPSSCGKMLIVPVFKKVVGRVDYAP